MAARDATLWHVLGGLSSGSLSSAATTTETSQMGKGETGNGEWGMGKVKREQRTMHCQIDKRHWQYADSFCS